MRVEQNGLNMVKGDDGMVLVMVLLVLLASILIGIFSMRTSNTEIKIAGNELAYKQDFYAAEGAAEYVVANFSSLIETVNTTTAMSVSETRNITSIVHNAVQNDIVPSGGDSIINDATVHITYERTFEDPVGSGLYTDHYRIDTKAGDQEIEVGIEW